MIARPGSHRARPDRRASARRRAAGVGARGTSSCRAVALSAMIEFAVPGAACSMLETLADRKPTCN
eukprot:133580-Hanusia_phi.AAC.2